MDKSAEYDVRGSDELNDGAVLGQKIGTAADQADMQRLGKEQLFKVGTSILLAGGRSLTASCSVTLAFSPFSASLWSSWVLGKVSWQQWHLAWEMEDQEV